MTLLLLLAAACTNKDLSESGVDDSAVEPDVDGDGFSASEDCDDEDAAINPAAEELCDGLDNNCDDQIDEGVLSTWYADADADGYGDDAQVQEACAAPEGYIAQGGDCDDSDAAYNPGAAEDDCADPNDYNCDGSVGYADNDDDGWAACEDCDDSDAAVNPGATEVCNGLDDDCDGTIDGPGSADASTWYADRDGDGYGDAASAQQDCEAPSGTVTDGSDCDDANAAVHPGATEVCNEGLDDDCDGQADDDDSDVDLSTAAVVYADDDGDGYGDADDPLQQCAGASGYVSDDTDCDDDHAAVNPGATEVCNGIDDDCDGDNDDDDSSVDLSTGSTWYSDSDGDTYGDPNASVAACDAPSGTVSNSSDCDDADAAVNPAATEVCNGVDDDCDGDVDDDDSSVDLSNGSTWYSDSDGDGYGDASASVEACDAPSGFVSDDTDCDDADATRYPSAAEVCDGVDNDCDAIADDGVLGTSAACPANDCAEILADNSSAGDGVYSITTPGGDFDVVCDMTTDGGGWTLALVINSVENGNYALFGSTYEDVADLQIDPATASSATTGVGGWLNINEFSYSTLRLASYYNGANTYWSNDIYPSELRIDFGQNGYLLYNDSNGYYWCGGDHNYTDSGSGQVNRPTNAPADCKGHGSLGHGWDFSTYDATNRGLTLCGQYSSWMYGSYGTNLTSYPAPGAAQAIWLR
ncbi:MAG: hypothetical protein H6739_29170 [Alphaproteobacteria bacterium]|nr:hypothetical protein [Alphaproteobacteria bacterium]